MNNVITHEIPEGYKARIEGNKVIIEREFSTLEAQLYDWLSSDTGGTLSSEKMKDCANARAKEIMQIVKDGGFDLSLMVLSKLPHWEKADKIPAHEDIYFIYDGYLYNSLFYTRMPLLKILNFPQPLG